MTQQQRDKLEIYERLLRRWNNAISLVQENTLSDFWKRHVEDSAQMLEFMPAHHKSILDVGSGAGFPGMILAIFGQQDVTLCDSHSKKCTFLSEVSRLTNTPVTIINDRIENIHLQYDIITSRAFSDILTTLRISKNVSRESTEYFFLKGASWQSEIDDASNEFRFEYKSIVSKTNSSSALIILKNVSCETE